MDQTGIDLDVGFQPMLLAQILSWKLAQFTRSHISQEGRPGEKDLGLGRLLFNATLQTETLTVLNEGVVAARSDSSWSVFQKNGQLSLQSSSPITQHPTPWYTATMCTPDGNAMNAMTSEAIHTTHCKYTDYSLIFTGESECMLHLPGPCMVWSPHTRIPLVVLQALVLVLPGWNHRMLPPCPMSRCPRLNPLPSASLDPSVERFQALGNVRPRDENLWQTLKKTTDLWAFWVTTWTTSFGKVSGAAHIMTLSVLPSWNGWWHLGFVPQSRSCCKNQVLSLQNNSKTFWNPKHDLPKIEFKPQMLDVPNQFKSTGPNSEVPPSPGQERNNFTKMLKV